MARCCAAVERLVCAVKYTLMREAPRPNCADGLWARPRPLLAAKRRSVSDPERTSTHHLSPLAATCPDRPTCWPAG